MVKKRVKIIVAMVGLMPSLVQGKDGINGDPNKLFGYQGNDNTAEMIGVDNCDSKKITNKQSYVGLGECWKACEALLPEGMTWPNMVQSYGQGQGDVAALWWPAMDVFMKREVEFKVDLDKEKDGTDRNNKAAKSMGKLLNFLQHCHALLTMSGHSDYEDADLARHGKDEYERTSRSNRRLTCRAMGLDTQDYPQCSRMITLYDTFTVAKKVKQTVDTIRYDAHVSGEQDKLMDKRMEGDTVGMEDSLNVQKKSFEKAKDITGEKLALSAAQMASLSAIVSSMPTVESLLQDECLPRMTGKAETYKQLYKRFQGSITVFSGDPHDSLDDWMNGTMFKEWGNYEPLDADPLCSSTYKTFVNLILNSDARQIGMGLFVQSGIEVAANAAMHALLKDRIKGLGGAIKKIEEFKPESLTEEEMEEIYLRECVVNPELPKCKISRRQQVDGVRNSYSFGPGNKPTLIGSAVESDNSGGGTNSSPDVNRSNVPKGLGVALPDANSLGNNNFSAPPPKAAAYAGKGKGNPGGGGSASAGSVSPPGKGAAGGGSGEGRSSGSPSGSSKVAYDGSGGGWKGYGSGGRGRPRRSGGKKDNNPFSKLFGKKKGEKGEGGELMEFRQPASQGKFDNIFQRISVRYGEASKGKQLLEYSAVKEDD